jgi:hypothetical protein
MKGSSEKTSNASHDLEYDENTHSSDPPPEYEELVQEVNIAQEDFNASARILGMSIEVIPTPGLKHSSKSVDDGRININIDQNERRLSSLFAPAYEDHLSQVNAEKHQQSPEAWAPRSLGDAHGRAKPPSINIVMHVVGSRGDV